MRTLNLSASWAAIASYLTDGGGVLPVAAERLQGDQLVMTLIPGFELRWATYLFTRSMR